MKKIYLLLFSILCVAQSYGQSDTILHPNVPKQITSSFSKTHPKAENLQWTRAEGTYIVAYEENKTNMWTTYDNRGGLIENKWKISMLELPSSMQDYIKKNNTSTVQQYYKMTDARGIVIYSIINTSNELFFDSRGTYVKTVEKTQ